MICLAAGVILLVFHFLPLGKGNLEITIKHTDYIMPAAYKVYANMEAANGEYYLFKMLMKNDGKAVLNDVNVSYRIPNYIDWTELETFPKIYPGQNVVVRCYPQFKDDIANKMTQSQEKVEIKIRYDGGRSENETYAFKMMGRNQFVYTDLPPEEIASYPDQFRNAQLLGCLVTPQDPIIKYYTQQIQEKLMKGEAASVTNKPEDAAKFLLGVYTATYLSHMVYSGTEGIPQKLGDINAIVQNIRLPREVMTGNTGLCVELSLLYASILKSAGLHPIIFLIPGHAYPGVSVGGQYYAIEATGVGGEGLGSRMSPEDAFKSGMKELNEFIQNVSAGDPRYSFVDIDAMEAKGVVPMELKDEEFLRKKVDEIARSFSQGNYRESQGQSQGKSNTYEKSEDSSGGSSNMRSYSGVVSFKYPAAWKRSDHPVRQWPFLVAVIAPTDGSSEIDVVSLPGANDSNEAMAYFSQQLAASGKNMRYQLTSSNNEYDLYTGATSSPNGANEEWQGVLRDSDNGVVGVFVGGTSYSKKANTYNSIISTVR